MSCKKTCLKTNIEWEVSLQTYKTDWYIHFECNRASLAFCQGCVQCLRFTPRPGLCASFWAKAQPFLDDSLLKNLSGDLSRQRRTWMRVRQKLPSLELAKWKLSTNIYCPRSWTGVPRDESAESCPPRAWYSQRKSKQTVNDGQFSQHWAGLPFLTISGTPCYVAHGNAERKTKHFCGTHNQPLNRQRGLLTDIWT